MNTVQIRLEVDLTFFSRATTVPTGSGLGEIIGSSSLVGFIIFSVLELEKQYLLQKNGK